MADRNRIPPPGKATSVPPPQEHYIAPHEEVWSDATQEAVDRHLGGRADVCRRDR